MPFVHGHPRETGWVVSHYRRPQQAGDDQLDLSLPAPRTGDDADRGAEQDEEQDEDQDEDEPRASVFSIPRRTASTR